jgi:hypothetical protein
MRNLNVARSCRTRGFTMCVVMTRNRDVGKCFSSHLDGKCFSSHLDAYYVIVASVDMSSPYSVVIVASPDPNPHLLNHGVPDYGFTMLYFDGPTTALRMNFVDYEASRIYVDFMSRIKATAPNYPKRDRITAKFRSQANRFLEMVASAEADGYVIPSILTAKTELVDMLAYFDETGMLPSVDETG